jgi:hypothetical protein
MSSDAPHLVSRRAALTSLAIAASSGSVVAEQASNSTPGENSAGPRLLAFRSTRRALWSRGSIPDCRLLTRTSARRQFALVGANGQRICVDPTSKLILVQAAVDHVEEVWRLWSALVEQFGQG